jgi:hypothetical protein
MIAGRDPLHVKNSLDRTKITALARRAVERFWSNLSSPVAITPFR